MLFGMDSQIAHTIKKTGKVLFELKDLTNLTMCSLEISIKESLFSVPKHMLWKWNFD